MQYGRKLITGHTNGEIHIWNGITLKFDTVNSYHEDGIKVMKWVKDHEWLLTADKKGKLYFYYESLRIISLCS
jgi:WD40 repeat protein